MIQVQGLTKNYGPRRAIENLSFHADKGEILGFLGPNGAGKTTTMRILTGFMPPTSGRASVAGFDVVDQSLEVRRRVGYMPESVPLYPDMTVFDYLKFMADLRHLPDGEDRVDGVLEQVHMVDRSESYISSLSKGLRQRVGLAQALLHEPEVLILDEPTIGLDPAHIIEVRNIIQKIGSERTVLLSTHILFEAQQVCNRVLIINNGRIVAEDTPEQLQSRLAGAQRVVLHVRGDLDELGHTLSQVAGVTLLPRESFTPVVTTGSSDGKFELETIPGEDIRPEIARAVVAAGFDLLEMRQVGMSLEEIFLELTRDEGEYEHQVAGADAPGADLPNPDGGEGVKEDA
jgi:ABC-2 type transport system ATP-binding protein